MCYIYTPAALQRGIGKTTKITLLCHMEWVSLLSSVTALLSCPNPMKGLTLFGAINVKQALIRPVHMSLTIKDVLPKLGNVKYLTLIDANYGYHNLNLLKNPT